MVTLQYLVTTKLNFIPQLIQSKVSTFVFDHFLVEKSSENKN